MAPALSPPPLHLDDDLRLAIAALLDDEPRLLARVEAWGDKQPDRPVGLGDRLTLFGSVLRAAFSSPNWDGARVEKLLADLTNRFDRMPSPDFVTSICRLRDALRAILAEEGLAAAPAEHRVELVADLALQAAARVWQRGGSGAARRLAQLERMHAAIREVNSLIDPRLTLHAVVASAQEEPEWDAVLLVETTPKGTSELVAWAGAEGAERPPAWETILEDTRSFGAEPRVHLTRDGRACLVVPFSSENAGGALLVYRRTGRTFEQSEIDYAAVFAAEALTVLTAASLYQKIRRDAVARDHFFSIVNHDLKSPLANIKAQADLLLRRLDRGKIALETDEGRTEVMSRLDQIGQRTRDLGRQIDDLVDVSRIEAQRFSVHLTRQDLTDIVEGAVKSLQAQHPERTIELVLARGPLWVEVDTVRMTQAISNLVGNALKYSPPTRPVRVQVERRGNSACVEVVDHGPGIPEEQRRQLFERYFRESQSRWHGTGLGLGLYIVAGIVRAHRGTVAVQSEVGVGSTFTVCLPLHSAGGVSQSFPHPST